MAENNSDGGKAVQSYISDLSNELLVEILCRLGPSKYATQCKCICKRWFSLISGGAKSDSYFLSRWRKIHQEDEEEQPIALLTQYPVWNKEEEDYDYDTDDIGEEIDSIQIKNHHAIDYLLLFNNDLPTFNPLNFLDDNKIDDIDDIETVTPICVLATFKDLVLCCLNQKDHSVYYICNPFTKQWIALPPSPLPPGYNIYSVQVGFAVLDDDDLKFKVVRLLPHPSEGLDKNMVKVETFSSDDRSCLWRERDISVPVYRYSLEVASYDGMLVWRSTYPGGIERVILFPDDTNANYTLLPLPVGYKGGSKSSCIGVCMGSLRIGQLVYSTPPCINSYSDNVPKLVIWELDKHSQDWEMVHELDFCEVDLRGGEYLEETSSTVANKWWFGSILAFHPRDRDILYLNFVLYDSSMTCSYNVKERTVEMIREIPLWEWISEVFPLEMPSWPTTIPLLSLPPELQNQHFDGST